MTMRRSGGGRTDRLTLTAAALALAAAVPLGAQDGPMTSQRPARCDDGRGEWTHAGVASAAIAANAALYVYFKNAWWSGEKRDFWVNWEPDSPFRDQDKFGHAYGGYHLARVGTDLLRATCVAPGRAALLGAVYAAAFQLQIEIWDGTQKEYGFSPPDLIANTTGTALAFAQARAPALRAFKPTVSYSPTAALRNAPAESELRPTIDYSGQTYWMSADLDALLPERARNVWPGLLRLSVGHSITDWVDPVTQRTQRADRRVLLSLDIDPEKLPGEHPVWKRIKHELSFYRFPAPALQIYPTTKGITWYR